MKKILMIAILCFVSLDAYEIQRTYWSGSGSTKYKAYAVECRNGKNITAQYYPSSNSYLDSSSDIHKTLSQAINNSCKKNKKITFIKKGSLVCPSQKMIQSMLKWNGIGVTVAKLTAGEAGECFFVGKSKVIILKSFPKEKYISKCGSAKSKKVTRIDSYFKVTDQRNNYYVRNSDLIK